MKTRGDFVSNSSSCSFVVDEETNSRYIDTYGTPELEGTPEERNGIKCVQYWGEDGEHTVDGYDNDEEYLEYLYDYMCGLNPSFIEWENHH